MPRAIPITIAISRPSAAIQVDSHNAVRMSVRFCESKNETSITRCGGGSRKRRSGSSPTYET